MDSVTRAHGRIELKIKIPDFVLNLLGRLHTCGYSAYIVGGALRDFLMGAEIQDWDIATNAQAEEIQAVFSELRLFRLKHDTVTVVHEGKSYELTPFRGQGRNSIHNDLSHRDFTINALAWDPIRDRVIDPCDGLEDISHRLIRAVGCPEDRFREDPLRMLRAIRFGAVLGFRVEGRTRRTITHMAPMIREVSRERIRDELIKILMSHRASKGLRWMHGTGLMPQILPELAEGFLKRQNHYHRFTILRHTLETVDAVEPDLLLRVSALFHDIAKPRVRIKQDGTWKFHGHEQAGAEMAQEIMSRLRFENALIKKTKNLIRHHLIGYNPSWTDSAVRRFIQRVGKEDVFNLLKLRKADILAHGRPELEGGLLDELEARVRSQIHEGQVLSRRQLAIDGRKIMELAGLTPGPRIGEIKRHLLEKVLDDPSLNNEADLSEMVREVLDKGI